MRSWEHRDEPITEFFYKTRRIVQQCVETTKTQKRRLAFTRLFQADRKQHLFLELNASKAIHFFGRWESNYEWQFVIQPNLIWFVFTCFFFPLFNATYNVFGFYYLSYIVTDPQLNTCFNIQHLVLFTGATLLLRHLFFLCPSVYEYAAFFSSVYNF